MTPLQMGVIWTTVPVCGRVEHGAATHVDADVVVPVDEVADLQVAHRHPREHRQLGVGAVGHAHPGLGPRHHGETRAVEGVGAGTGVFVGLPELGVRVGHHGRDRGRWSAGESHQNWCCPTTSSKWPKPVWPKPSWPRSPRSPRRVAATRQLLARRARPRPAAPAWRSRCRCRPSSIPASAGRRSSRRGCSRSATWSTQRCCAPARHRPCGTASSSCDFLSWYTASLSRCAATDAYFCCAERSLALAVSRSSMPASEPERW